MATMPGRGPADRGQGPPGPEGPTPSPRIRAALDPPRSVLVVAVVTWLALFVVIAVLSLGVFSFVVALVWAALLIYLGAVVIYAFVRDEESPVKRWLRAPLNASRGAAMALTVAWVVLSLVLVLGLWLVNLGGITFLLGFIWAIMLAYLVMLAAQDYARQ